ncbi:MAG: response regulator [Deltaproteobacteria bacterium]|nr:response regulator [Deltaproteobacteria bacterium]
MKSVSVRHILSKVLIPLACLLVLQGCLGKTDRPLALKGCLDLKFRDLAASPVNLDGQWAFYWQTSSASPHIPKGPLPQDTCFLKDTAFIKVPGFWHKAEGVNYPVHGFATYRLILLLPEDASGLALKLGTISSAYTLTINGQTVGAGGKVGRDRKSTLPWHKVDMVDLDRFGSRLDIRITAANFHNWSGGILDHLLLGPRAALERGVKKQFVLNLILFGSLMIMGIYHLALFVLRPKDTSTLYFGIFCLCVALWHATVDPHGRFIDLLVPGITWEWITRTEVLSFYLSIPAFALFLRSIFPVESSTLITRIYQWAGLIFSLAVVLSPPHVFTETLFPYEILTATTFVYVIRVLILAVKHGRQGAVYMLIGFPIFWLTGINDILYGHRLIETGVLIPYGLFIFIISHSFVISLRFSKAFSAVEQLSVELNRKNEELYKANRIKDEFLANTSHELRTPLNGIIGIAESLKEGAAGELNQAARNNLTMIISSARRLTALINDILDFSKLRHRDIQIRKQAVDIKGLARTVLSVCEPMTRGRPLVLENKIPDHLPNALGDEDRLQQILFNLVGNAVKFTPEGQVRILAEEKGDFLSISVQDTGIGIPQDKLEEIFHSFEQGDTSASRRFGGTGLGLAVTRKLVELHGGTVTVASKEGKGATFTFTIPKAGEAQARRSGEQETASTGDRTALPEPLPGIMAPEPFTETASGPIVLAVDDEPVNLQVIANHLGLAGIPVRTATGGGEALKWINAHGLPDLLLLDIMMPGMTGYEVCRHLRRDHSPSELPIIMVTARNRVSDLVQGFDQGANDYLTKPFTRGELLARIKTQLKLKEAYTTLKENVRLRRELNLRRITEQRLKETQKRLDKMLDTVAQPLAAVNESLEICFSNRALETLLGRPAEALLGRPAADFFEMDFPHIQEIHMGNNGSGNYPDTLIKSAKGKKRLDITLTSLEFGLDDGEGDDQEQLLLLILSPSAWESDRAVALVRILNRHRERFQTLKASLGDLIPEMPDRRPDLALALESLDKGLVRINRILQISEGEPDRRSAAVTVMQTAVKCWQEANGASKAELAKESNLWSVYVDRDGWGRTQTLDKYLSLSHLPKHPRYEKVIRTGEFVLNGCDLSHESREELEAALTHLA